MGRQGKSEATIQIYKWGINDLIRYAKETGTVIKKDSLERWADAAHARLSQRSFALAGVAVRRLLVWALAEGHIHDHGLVQAVPTGKYDRIKIPNTLTPSTLIRLERYLL